ncbi:MAG: hypothetical protein HFF08_07455 [Oscillospiraceae bacterium]|nr:hypothetical protein [Oscillospiraceae bacterium]
MHWQNYNLVDPVAHKQEWKTTVKPNFATLVISLLILVFAGIYKPILLFGLVPVFAGVGIVWWRLADRALKKKKAAYDAAAKIQEGKQPE